MRLSHMIRAQTSPWIHHQQFWDMSLGKHTLVELCTGVGALGVGAKAAGWTVEAHNEIQEAFCNHLKECGVKTVVEGDLCKLQTVVQIHQTAPKAGAMAWGFSCQPFSKLGDQQHGGDPRSQTLPYGLYAAYLLQKDLNIIECVPQAATSPFVQQCLAYHIAMTRAEKSETLLELGQLWPSARRRWWCVLMHESFQESISGSFQHLRKSLRSNNYYLNGFL